MNKFDEKKFKRFLLREYALWANPLVVLTVLPISIPGFLYNQYQIARNKIKSKGHERARCLIFDEPLIEWQNLFLGAKGVIARFFTQRGVRVDYIHNATSEDLRSTLEDENYQHIILQGHGNRNKWVGRDGVIYTEDIDEWMSGVPKKSGYFIQFTCGDNKGRPLGYSAIQDRTKILGFTKPVNLGDRFELLFGNSSRGLEELANINDSLDVN